MKGKADREEADRNLKTAWTALEEERTKRKFYEHFMKRQAELDREADRKMRATQEELERFKRQQQTRNEPPPYRRAESAGSSCVIG